MRDRLIVFGLANLSLLIVVAEALAGTKYH